MKKICSLLLIVSLLLGMCAMLGVQSAAAPAVDATYAQSNINDFINFMRKNGTLKNDSYYVFDEKDDVKTGLTIKPYYYYYIKDNFIRIKGIALYADVTATVIFTLPGIYSGKATIDYDYSDKNGETLQAKAVVSIPAYNGKNAAFKKTGGNSAETQEQINKTCNFMANHVLISSDNAVYNNKRIPGGGFYSFGFCSMCDAHAWEPCTVRSTFVANGVANKVICHWCARVKSAGKTIPQVAKASIPKTAYYYTGKAISPKVTVKDIKGNVLKEKTDYTVSYAKGRTAIGKYALTVKLKGNYLGTKTLYYTINPGKPKIAKITAGKKALALKWGKINSVSGYQIQYAQNSSFTSAKAVTAKGAATLTKTISSLQSGKRYYVRMRSYKATTFGGEKLYIYSGWSDVKSIAVK